MLKTSLGPDHAARYKIFGADNNQYTSLITLP